MLIKGAAILQEGKLIKNCDILIEGNRIIEIGRDLGDDSTIDADGMLAIPGLINGHTHLAMTLFRGYADDMALMPWLEEKIWPLEAKLTSEDIYWGAKLGCLELIRFGVTCYNDMYYFMDEAARATKEMGLRAYQSVPLLDMRPDLLESAEPFLRRWQNDELITPAIGPHAVYTCCEETLLKAVDLSDKYNVMQHIHLAETKREVDEFKKEHGQTPVEFLSSIGFLSEKVLAAHCTWVSPGDIRMLAERKVNVVLCRVSNLKLASGIAPLSDLLAAGVNVCLGTDGASSNNNLNIFEEMKVVAIVEKNARSRPEALTANETWKLGTDNSYQAFNLKMGLFPGALADLCLIDLQKPWFYPVTNIISHLVYSMPGLVDTTIVNGKVLMRNGIIPGEEHIIAKAQEQFEDLLTR
jgi:5-methylthioadenosine/S-adenosylhomocysteine deaminase